MCSMCTIHVIYIFKLLSMRQLKLRSYICRAISVFGVMKSSIRWPVIHCYISYVIAMGRGLKSFYNAKCHLWLNNFVSSEENMLIIYVRYGVEDAFSLTSGKYNSFSYM